MAHRFSPRRRAGRREAALLLAAMLAGCSVPVAPLTAYAPQPDAPIMRLRDGAGITVKPVAGLDGPAGRALAEAMAAALRAAELPATTAAQNRGSYLLIGQAAAPRPDAPGPLALRWELVRADGLPVAQAEQTLPPDGTAFGGDGALLARLAAGAAPQIAGYFQDPGDGAVDTGQRIVVPPVAGAPGDGPQALANAMRNALRDGHVEVADGPADRTARHYTVAGTVALTPSGPGTQTVTVSWALLGPDGGRIGEVRQANDIPAGSLDGRWGDVAEAVARSAAGGIVALLDHLKTLSGAS